MNAAGWFAIICAVVAILMYRGYEPLPACFDDAPTDVRIGLLFKPAVDTLAGLLDHMGLITKTQLQRALLKIVQRREADNEAMGSVDTELDGVPARVYIPSKRQANGSALFYVHGGAWVLGDVNVYDHIVRHFASQLGIVAVSFDYKLAPEFPFPAGLDDVERAFRYFAQHAAEFDVDCSRIAIGGDSSGGNLAAALALRLRDAADLKKEPNVPRVKFQILIYPSVQVFEFSSVSRLINMHDFVDPRYNMIAFRLQYILGNDFYNTTLRRLVKRYFYGQCYQHRPELRKRLQTAYQGNAGKGDLRERILTESDREFKQLLQSDDLARKMYLQPNCTITSEKELTEVEGRVRAMFEQDVSPLLASSLQRLPPTYIAYAGIDGMRDDALLYALRLRDDGVLVFEKNFDNECHSFINVGKVAKVLVDLRDVLSKNPALW